jgi:NADPH:quinone reductase-like Zn-dependent oxidoreductase
MTPLPATQLQIQTLITADGELRVSLAEVPLLAPAPNEVIVRIEAAPINPSDLGLLFGAADMSAARRAGTADRPEVWVPVPPAAMRAMTARIDQPLPAGNEAGGVVLAAGSSSEAQALVGKTVGVMGGEMYAQYRCARLQDCLPVPEGTTAREAASCFVNPLTALSMTEVMRREGHTALVHTAAASNLGQMLVKICAADEIPLVNIVRSSAQAELLRGIGAKYVLDSTTPDFIDALTKALTETGATLAFDAVGGGKLTSQILTAMEIAASARMTSFSRYGSDTFKQVYIYGVLDMSPTPLTRSFGFAWGVSGFLLTSFLQKIGIPDVIKMRARVAAELKTTFASHYTRDISLTEMLDLATVQAYCKRATGEKFLVTPHG